MTSADKGALGRLEQLRWGAKKKLSESKCYLCGSKNVGFFKKVINREGQERER